MSDAKDVKSAPALRRINDVKVDPIPLRGSGKLKVVGAELFARPYANVGVFGPTNSGKTTVIRAIIHRCATPETTVFLFCSTGDMDEGWQVIKEECEEKGIPVVMYDEIGENLRDIMQDAKDEKTAALAAAVEEEEEEQFEAVPAGNGVVEVVKKKKKEPKPAKEKRKKYVPLERLVIFDDMGDQLRSPLIAQWCKTSRHYRAKTVISTQWFTDVLPATRRQLGYILLFRNMNDDNLKQVIASAGVPLDLEKFKRVYQTAIGLTNAAGRFLYLDTLTGEMRKNFSDQIVLTH